MYACVCVILFVIERGWEMIVVILFSLSLLVRSSLSFSLDLYNDDDDDYRVVHACVCVHIYRNCFMLLLWWWWLLLF